MKIAISFLALAGLLILSDSNPAGAAPLYFDFNQVGAADIVTLNYAAAGLDGGSYYAGQYQVESSPNADFSGATSFNTFCVDLFDDVSVGQQYLVNPQSTDDGLTNGAAVAYLYNSYGTAAISLSGTTTYSDSDGTFTLANSDYAAALQLAIWDELANNGQPSSASTVFQYSNVNADTLAQISRFLTDASANSAGSVATWLDSHVGVAEPAGFVLGQGFIAPASAIPAAVIATPEPSTLVLAALGLLPIVVACRRRTKTGIQTA
ncbi:MAG TPA: PEP-CTERM sorting domain-containing protein [Pirellulales bacterium]